MMWDGGGFRVCGGDFVELGKNKRRKERYNRRANPDLGFTAYDSIHEIKINTQSK